MRKYDVASMDKSELESIIGMNFCTLDEGLLKEAENKKKEIYGDSVYFRGLIEFTNICKNGCYYCGINCTNTKAERYRLTKNEILECCAEGYALGFRTFVLQGGEDNFYTDSIMTDIIYSIKQKYDDCALTISFGEKSKDTYKKYFDAGADRYLLRHESASEELYKKLHPSTLTLDRRKRCLYDLKEIGFQVGAGFMVGAPFQTVSDLAEDLLFLKQLQPHMVGVGPFIPHKDTIFRDKSTGGLEQSIVMLALVRLMLPKALIPATTALGTICDNGRELGIRAGANVVMPNLSPKSKRSKYLLYDNKISTGDEAAESVKNLSKRLEAIGVKADFSRGDHASFIKK